MAQYRYPGVQPFSTAQEHIFFGREQDMQALYLHIRLKPLVVLHAKSGLGKSSLLNAGIVPQFLKDGKYRPVNVRFNAYSPTSEAVQLPLEATREAIRTASESLNKSTFLEKLLPQEDSLWYLLKKEQAHNGNHQQMLLIFDQFEELFTYPDAAILQFKIEMAEVLHTQIPQRFRQLVEQEVERPSHLDAEQLALLHEPFGTKVVMAIRSDRISLLDRIADYLPQVKQTWFELDALGRDQAEEAILNPAYKRGEFASPVFDYADEAIEGMLNFLTKDGTEKIESFQLQILCQAIERRVISGKLKQVSANDLGNIKEVYENYYEDQILLIEDPVEQKAARHLIEDGLIFEEESRRLSLYEGQIFKQFGISEALLRKLVDTHLIRREPSMKGGYTYELSHDTLVAPVLRTKEQGLIKQRQAREEAERLERERELTEAKRKIEEERQLRENAESKERKTKRYIIPISLLILTVLLGLLMVTYTGGNFVYVATIENEDIKYDRLSEAAKNLEEANWIFELTNWEYGKVKKKKEAAGSALTKAQSSIFKIEKSKSKVVRQLIELANDDILKLQYESALKKIKAASRLGALNNDVAKASLEISFWYGEVGNTFIAEDMLNTAAKLVNKAAHIRTPFRNSIKEFDTPTFKMLMERYYPVMVKVHGGIFNMGCDTRSDSLCPNDEVLHKQQVSSFEMSKFETTWFQYYLFSRATGHFVNWAMDTEDTLGVFDVVKYNIEFPSNLGSFGNEPVKYITWFEAIEYANWINNQLGEQEAISKNDDGKYTVNLYAGYRLPTEAEWEYAAKGGKTYPSNITIYSGSNDLDEVGWYSDNSEGKVKPIGTKKANKLGLYDMSGNIYEWCWDSYGPYPNPAPKDFTGSQIDSLRVCRGGSCYNDPANLRCANRNYFLPGSRNFAIGFRLARAAR